VAEQDRPRHTGAHTMIVDTGPLETSGAQGRGRPALNAPGRVTVIRPTGRLWPDMRELFEFRELFLVLTARDIKVRYKQTALGAAWAVLQPLIATLIFSVIFGRFAKIPSEGVPYPVFVFTGLLAWNYLQNAVTRSAASLVSNTSLITKVYFPRIVVPVAGVAAPLVDFLLAAGVLLGIMGWYGIVPSWHALAVLPFLALAVATALGIGLLLAPLNARYRDVPYVMPFLVQIWMFASPVVYPVTLIPDRWRFLLSVNPMTGVIDGFRWALLDRGSLSAQVIATSTVTALLLLLAGIVYFERSERRLADVI
jgi:lipopolysaccharide transport system permease protein